MDNLCFNALRVNVHPIDSALEPYNGKIIYDQSSNKLKTYLNGVWQDVSIHDDITRQYPNICPNCGAPHNPSSNHCEYCGTYFK